MSIWTDLWNLFFPRCCAVCGRLLSSPEEVLCVHCLAGLPRTNLHRVKGNKVEQNFWGKFPVEHATSFLYYTRGGDVSRILRQLKYHGYKEIGEVMGRIAAAELKPSGFFDGIDYLIPVALHKRKQRKRGYNQSEWICLGLSRITGIPVLADALVRNKNTETQTHKGQYARWENVQNIFSCPNPTSLRGKHILLVDDVLTTGATLVACTDALKDIPDLRISVFTLTCAGE